MWHLAFVQFEIIVTVRFENIDYDDLNKLIEDARKIINSDFICFVFVHDKRHLKWIIKMINVLFSTNFGDLKILLNKTK